MSNVIRFLEDMAGNAAMARMSAEQYSAAVAALDADDDSRLALAARNASWLGEALDARSTMMCVVVEPGVGEA